jgi:hypothetical protein
MPMDPALTKWVTRENNGSRNARACGGRVVADSCKTVTCPGLHLWELEAQFFDAMPPVRTPIDLAQEPSPSVVTVAV